MSGIDHHATCHHKTYELTCDEFDSLLERAGYACELCGKRDIKLWIDHDHDEAKGCPVRGLVCAKCNAHMRMVDVGRRHASPTVDAYLARALTKRRKIKTYARTFWCPDVLWTEARAAAKERGESLSEEIRKELRRYLERGLR